MIPILALAPLVKAVIIVLIILLLALIATIIALLQKLSGEKAACAAKIAKLLQILLRRKADLEGIASSRRVDDDDIKKIQESSDEINMALKEILDCGLGQIARAGLITLSNDINQILDKTLQLVPDDEAHKDERDKIKKAKIDWDKLK